MIKLLILPLLLISTLLAQSDLNLLSLSWHNAFCAKHKNRKECRDIYNHSKDHFVLHGLWPNHQDYCEVSYDFIENDKHHRWRALPKIEYPKDLYEDMLIYMPGVLSALDRHEWVKHGTCYDSDPIKYFSDAISLTKQVDNSMVGEYFRANIGGKINLYNLRKIFDRSFGKGSGKRVVMKCKGRVITELRINLKGKGNKLEELIKDAPINRARSCKEGFVLGNN